MPSASILQFIVIFMLSWQALFRIPNIAVNLLFKFLSILLLKIAKYTKSKVLEDLTDYFPDTLTKALRYQSVSLNDFEKFVVCPKCYSTSEILCWRDRFEMLICSLPQTSSRTNASHLHTPLLKIIKTATKSIIHRPRKVYCFRSVVQLINEIVCRPGIFTLLSHWKDRKVPEGIMTV